MNIQKILVVDDEQNIRDIYQAFLQDVGYTVYTATDGFDALEKAAAEPYDLYIIDIYMPRMGGLELISRLKEIQPTAVIIVMTGYSGLDVDFRSIRQAAFMYLSKPIQPDELLRAVEAGLAKSLSGKQVVKEVTREVETESERSPQSILLHGFTQDQVLNFRSIGVLKEYPAGSGIPIDKDEGGLIFVERGSVTVFLGDTVVDVLKEGDVFGEESFVNPNTSFTMLMAKTDTLVRHFLRQRLIHFFSDSDKTLTDRYLLNTVQCMYVKWKRSVKALAKHLKEGS